VNPPPGCRFHPRCPHVMPRCSAHEPRLIRAESRLLACHLFEEVAHDAASAGVGVATR
jgi:ABC-type dipeptide/oligopeptide/nickel transport system ATPase component